MSWISAWLTVSVWLPGRSEATLGNSTMLVCIYTTIQGVDANSLPQIMNVRRHWPAVSSVDSTENTINGGPVKHITRDPIFR